MSTRVAAFLLTLAFSCAAHASHLSLGLASLPIGTDPTPVTIADANGDGKLDIVANTFGDDAVSVLLNNGDGTFQAPRQSS